MRYLEVPEEYRDQVKELAYLEDPQAWESYSGKPISYKQAMEYRRSQSLDIAASAWGDTFYPDESD